MSEEQDHARGDQSDRSDRFEAMPRKRLFAVFFLSGMAAILYQLVWQRSLFTTYGSNSEAIAAIVAAFMLGLGLGSAVGGWASLRFADRLVPLFALIELSIGAFGIISVPLLASVGEATAGVDALAAGALSFAIIVLPTMLMGSTLPLLTAHLVARDESVGEAIGDLYYINTLGSAAACVLASLFLFRFLGISGSIWLAAALNVFVAGVTFFTLRGPSNAAAPSTAEPQ